MDQTEFILNLGPKYSTLPFRDFFRRGYLAINSKEPFLPRLLGISKLKLKIHSLLKDDGRLICGRESAVSRIRELGGEELNLTDGCILLEHSDQLPRRFNGSELFFIPLVGSTWKHMASGQFYIPVFYHWRSGCFIDLNPIDGHLGPYGRVISLGSSEMPVAR